MSQYCGSYKTLLPQGDKTVVNFHTKAPWVCLSSTMLRIPETYLLTLSFCHTMCSRVHASARGAHDGEEFLLADFAVLVSVEFLDHGAQLLFAQVLSEVA